MNKPVVLVLGPDRSAVSGVATHLTTLMDSSLSQHFELHQFQVGSEGTKPELLAQKIWRALTSPITFAMACLRTRANLVHINTSLEPRSFWRDTVYLVIARLLNRRVIYQVHGGALPQVFFGSRPLGTALVRGVLNVPDVIVLLARVEVSAYQAFLPQARLERIPNAIDIAAWKMARSAKPAAQPLRLCYAGRIVLVKGLMEALEAMAQLRTNGIPLQFDIAGSGPDLETLKQKASQLGLTDVVRFLGPTHGEAIRRFWKEGDIFIFPTAHREGIPYALLEAMCAGVVPITTRVGGIPDVVEDGVNGVLVEPQRVDQLVDAIAQLDADRQRLSQFSEAAARTVAGDYGIDPCVERFRRVYETLCQRK
jgi:glycosyltransferase involved in cell wall biosynthesis